MINWLCLLIKYWFRSVCFVMCNITYWRFKLDWMWPKSESMTLVLIWNRTGAEISPNYRLKQTKQYMTMSWLSNKKQGCHQAWKCSVLGAQWETVTRGNKAMENKCDLVLRTNPDAAQGYSHRSATTRTRCSRNTTSTAHSQVHHHMATM